MDRRGFISGVVQSIVAASSVALVKIASPQDVAKIKAADPVLMRTLPKHGYECPWDLHDVYIKARNGSFVAIGTLTSIEVHQPMIDVTSHWDGNIRMIPGGFQTAAATFRGWRE